jgi:cobalt-precorrin-7 (C5)-methyltransferase
MEHIITVVGIGPGSPDYLLPIAQKAINEAQVLVGSKRALAQFAPKGSESKVINKDIAGTLTYIRQRLIQTDVVVMVSGDPGFYSMLTTLQREFSADKLRVLPGLSSVQLAFAEIGLSWHDATLISFHGREAAEGLAYSRGRKLGILTDNTHNPAYIARLLSAAGWPAESKVWLCERLSYEDQQIIKITLRETERISGFAQCVMVVT